GFASPALWWDSALSDIPFDPATLVRFVAGDFTGDGRVDAGLLVSGVAPPPPAPTPVPSDPGASAEPSASAAPGEPSNPGASMIPGASQPAPGDSASPSAEPTPTPAPTAPPTPLPTSSPSPGPSGPFATLWILPGNVSGFLAPVPTWSGPL